MSGAPLLAKEDGQWKVIGILLGGPAVLGHFELNSMAAHWSDPSKVIKIAEELKIKAEERDEMHFIEVAYKVAMALIGTSKGIAFPILKTFYYELIKITCDHIRSRHGGKMLLEIINHNLVLPLYLYRKRFF
jgi:hypothetical protein